MFNTDYLKPHMRTLINVLVFFWALYFILISDGPTPSTDKKKNSHQSVSHIRAFFGSARTASGVLFLCFVHLFCIVGFFTTHQKSRRCDAAVLDNMCVYEMQERFFQDICFFRFSNK